MTNKIHPADISKFVALGGTYNRSGSEDWGMRWPNLWLVPSEGIVFEGDAIRIPSSVSNVECCPELSVVIDEPMWNVSAAEAWEGIQGFTITNDVTATSEWPSLPRETDNESWTAMQKLFPTFSPILSSIVPRDDVSIEDSPAISMSIDGERVFDGSLANFRFEIAEMVAFATRIVKLEPGDVIALGGPQTPNKYIDDANDVVCAIEGVGKLKNPVINS